MAIMGRIGLIAAANTKLIVADILKRQSWANVTLKYTSDYRLVGVDITARNEAVWTQHTFASVNGDDAEAREFIARLNRFDTLGQIEATLQGSWPQSSTIRCRCAHSCLSMKT